MRLDWMADGEIGSFVGDYVSTSWVGGRPVPVVMLAGPPVDGELRQSIFAATRIQRFAEHAAAAALTAGLRRLTRPCPWTQRPSVAVIGAALDLGSGRRGVDMGPSAIRYAGLETRLAALGVRVVDLGNVPAPVAEATAEGDERLRYLEPILRDVRADRGPRGACGRGGADAARPRRRPLDRARHARRAGAGAAARAACSGSMRTPT